MAVTGGGAEGGEREEEAEESTGGVRDIRSRSRRNGSTQVNRGSGGGSYYWRIRVLETVCLLVILHIPACSGKLLYYSQVRIIQPEGGGRLGERGRDTERGGEEERRTETERGERQRGEGDREGEGDRGGERGRDKPKERAA